MANFKTGQLGWTNQDRVTFAKWLKAVCAFYAALALLVFAGLGVFVAGSGQTRTTAAITSAPNAR